MWGRGRFDGETLRVLIYVNGLYSNISNAIGMKAALLTHVLSKFCVILCNSQKLE